MIRFVIVLGLLLAACGNGVDTDDRDGLGDPEAGAEVLANLDISCGACHTIEALGFSSEIAPNLDELSPSYDRIVEAITTGPGEMPSFDDTLTDSEIRDLAAYIHEAVRP